jgi:TRAP-type C4-dicarboxylate transport system substrate-binding protein
MPTLATAAPLVLKIGSVAPEATPWGDALNRLAAEWKLVSNGQVELKIYHGSIAGGEADSIRKMRLGQLQGAVLTSFGLNELAPDFLTTSIPFLIETNAELTYVMDKLTPYFAAEIDKEKFHVVAWSKAGWVKFFSRTPVRVPNDLKKLKLATNPVDQALFETWQSMGYDQVPVELPDTLTALNSGRIDALYSSPIAVGGFQWFGIAKYMSSLNIAPFMGGIVLTQAAWNKIPVELRAKLNEASARVTGTLDGQIAKLEVDVLTTMKTYGLKEVVATPADTAVWKSEMALGIDKLLGKSFSREVYVMIVAALKEYRAK